MFNASGFRAAGPKDGSSARQGGVGRDPKSSSPGRGERLIIYPLSPLPGLAEQAASQYPRPGGLTFTHTSAPWLAARRFGVIPTGLVSPVYGALPVRRTDKARPFRPGYSKYHGSLCRLACFSRLSPMPDGFSLWRHTDPFVEICSHALRLEAVCRTISPLKRAEQQLRRAVVWPTRPGLEGRAYSGLRPGKSPVNGAQEPNAGSPFRTQLGMRVKVSPDGRGYHMSAPPGPASLLDVNNRPRSPAGPRKANG